MSVRAQRRARLRVGRQPFENVCRGCVVSSPFLGITDETRRPRKVCVYACSCPMRTCDLAVQTCVFARALLQCLIATADGWITVTSQSAALFSVRARVRSRCFGFYKTHTYAHESPTRHKMTTGGRERGFKRVFPSSRSVVKGTCCSQAGSKPQSSHTAIKA